MKNKNKKRNLYPICYNYFCNFQPLLILLLADIDHTLKPGRNASLLVLKDLQPSNSEKKIGLPWVFFKKKYWATYFPKEKTVGLVMLLDGPQRPHNPVYSLLLRITTQKKVMQFCH